MDTQIIMLATQGKSTAIIYNALSERFNIQTVIIEEPISRKIFLKRRVKKLGIIKVFGQIIFQAFILPFLKHQSKKRTHDILKKNQLNSKTIDPKKIILVKSINDEETAKFLKKLRPHIVIINGTRIIAPHILKSTDALFINMHAGITPLYRGVHGAYWALANNDKAHCGVTIHQVDEGIDTGNILAQTTVEVTKEDNFATYSILQLAAGIPLLIETIKKASSGELTLTQKKPNLESKLWSHPTLFEYLYFAIKRKIF